MKHLMRKIYMKKNKERFIMTVFTMLLLMTGCSPDGNQDAVSGNSTADTEISEDQIYALSDNIEQGVPSDSGQTLNFLEDEAPEEDDGIFYTMEDIKALDIPEDMLAYWFVLNSKMPFAGCGVGGQEFYWDVYFFSFGGLDTAWKEMYWDDPMLFNIVDMNNDGKNEITISYADMVRMLHYEDGMVYVYQLFNISPIYENGIFAIYGGSGSGYESFNRFTELRKDGYRFETIAMTQNNEKRNCIW